MSVQPGPEATPEPVPNGEDAQWAALQQEIDTEDQLLETSEPVKEEPAAAEPEQRAQPSYEELQTNYGNLQKALQQTRHAARQSDERLAGITELIANLRAQKQPAQQEEAPKGPTVEEDPIGYFQAELAKRDQIIQGLQQGTQQSVEQMQAQQHEAQFWGAVERSEIEIRKTAPDYDDACRHLEGARIKELEIMLPDNSPRAAALAQQSGLSSPAELRAAMLNRDRVAVAQQALMLGTSPAQLYYQLAKQRGFAGAAQPNGQAKNPAMEAARRGQKAAKTLSGGTGSRASGDMSVDDLADLYAEDPEAFDKEWDKMARAGRLG